MENTCSPLGVFVKAVAFAADTDTDTDTDTVIEVRNDCIPERTGH